MSLWKGLKGASVVDPSSSSDDLRPTFYGATNSPGTPHSSNSASPSPSPSPSSSSSLKDSAPLASSLERKHMMQKMSTKFYAKSNTRTDSQLDLNLPDIGKTANFSHRHLGDASLYEVVEILKMNRITELNLDSNSLTEEGIKVLLENLRRNTSLTKFNIADNHIRDGGLEMIFQAFEGKPLVELDVSNNGITRLSADCIIDIANKLALKTLRLRENFIYPEAARLVAESIQFDSCTLTELDVSQCKLNDESAKVLINAIKSSSNITKLSIGGNDLTTVGIKDIMASVKDTSIVGLDLSDNVVGDDLDSDFLDLLMMNRIEVLDASGMNLGANSIRAIFDNLNLKSLILQNTEIDAGLIARLADNLQSNTSLTHLDLKASLSPTDVQQSIESLASIFAKNVSLESLDLQLNSLNDDCAAALATGFSRAPGTLTLRELNLAVNDISERGLESILKYSKLFPNNTVINMEDNLANNLAVDLIIQSLNPLNVEVEVILDNNKLTLEASRKLADFFISKKRKFQAKLSDSS